MPNYKSVLGGCFIILEESICSNILASQRDRSVITGLRLVALKRAGSNIGHFPITAPMLREWLNMILVESLIGASISLVSSLKESCTNFIGNSCLMNSEIL